MEQNNILTTNTEILSEFLYKNKMDVEDVMEMLSKEMTNKKKREFVLSQCNVPDKPNFKTKQYRKVIKKNGKRYDIIANSYNELIDKLYNFFNNQILDTKFHTIYKLAYKNFVDTVDRSPSTYRAYDYYYKRFINDELCLMDIHDITQQYLKTYTKILVKNNSMTSKAFLKYKGILNLVFDFAVDKGIIEYNVAKSIVISDYNKSLLPTIPKSESKIFSLEELSIIKQEIYKRMTYKKYKGFYSNGYAILLSMMTAMRAGEICALKWSDIKWDKNKIWIHSQQLKENTPKGEPNRFYDVPWTKNERGCSTGGRYFPIDKELLKLLEEIQNKQSSLNILSEYVICQVNGEPIRTDAYETALRRLCRSLGFNITNNHAFRMTYNSLILIPSGFHVTERAALLGHSVQTNLNNYSHDDKDSINKKINKLDSFKHCTPQYTL